MKVFSASGLILDGTAKGEEFQINTTTYYNQDTPAISGLDNGGFVVTWEDDNKDGSGEGVYAQRFDNQGAPEAVPSSGSTRALAAVRKIPRSRRSITVVLVIAWQDGSTIYTQMFGETARPREETKVSNSSSELRAVGCRP